MPSDFWVDPGHPAGAGAPNPARCQGEVERAAAMLAKAKRPIIMAGGGVHISEAHDALLAFAEAQGIPVAHTMSGKGSIACVNPLSAGLFGRYDRIANTLIDQSDCLLVVGCKLGEIATKRFQLIAPEKPVMSISKSTRRKLAERRARKSLLLATRVSVSKISAQRIVPTTVPAAAPARTISASCRSAWRNGAPARRTASKALRRRSMSAA